jgi:hypothetical protein
MATELEHLVTLLLHLVEKVPYLSEVEHDAELDLLRAVESDLGVSGVVAPKAGPTNAPAPAPVPPPAPVAEPVPAAEQTPPPVSPEVAGAAPEATNAFSGTDPAPA